VIRPDVGVWQVAPEATAAGTGPGVLTAPAPVESTIVLEAPLELLSVELRTVQDLVLVTAIEILSPVNKRKGHDAQRAYLEKRRDLLRSAAHLVEIDLLRAGERPPLASPVPEAPYYVTVSRSHHRPSVQVWPIQLWDRLPDVPIPLLRPDPDVPLALGELLATVYEEGGYDLLVDYAEPPPGPLSDAQAEWLDRWLSERGAR
jgi:hypothetical protein